MHTNVVIATAARFVSVYLWHVSRILTRGERTSQDHWDKRFSVLVTFLNALKKGFILAAH